MYEYGCFGLWPLVAGQLQRYISNGTGLLRPPVMSVSSKNGVIHTPPSPFLLNRRTGRSQPETTQLYRDTSSFTLMCNFHNSRRHVEIVLTGEQYLLLNPQHMAGQVRQVPRARLPGEWIHPPITVDVDGDGAGELFRWKFVPSNDCLALVQSARREKRNESRRPFTGQRIWTLVGGHPARG
ncbi:uncharacterized protein TrAtP1_005793 [Trichoderma atroviride]|uniref:uncharacterized protein n=1 Tax=Hypocrea atroviridis TaxID=63577 RepID=UPI00331697C5|nr:hypothetical protein TrAtP1_005793 [Trichoderma atroviride]